MIIVEPGWILCIEPITVLQGTCLLMIAPTVILDNPGVIWHVLLCRPTQPLIDQPCWIWQQWFGRSDHFAKATQRCLSIGKAYKTGPDCLQEPIVEHFWESVQHRLQRGEFSFAQSRHLCEGSSDKACIDRCASYLAIPVGLNTFTPPAQGS